MLLLLPPLPHWKCNNQLFIRCAVDVCVCNSHALNLIWIAIIIEKLCSFALSWEFHLCGGFLSRDLRCCCCCIIIIILCAPIQFSCLMPWRESEHNALYISFSKSMTCAWICGLGGRIFCNSISTAAQDEEKKSIEKRVWWANWFWHFFVVFSFLPHHSIQCSTIKCSLEIIRALKKVWTFVFTSSSSPSHII